MQEISPAIVISENASFETTIDADLGADTLHEVSSDAAAIAVVHPLMDADLDASNKAFQVDTSWWWLLLSLCPPLLLFQAVQHRRWRPVLFHLIGWLGFLIYSNYHDPWMLLLRIAAIPIWTTIGSHRPSKAKHLDPAKPGAAQPPKVWSDRETWLWALGHLVPLLWIHVALQRRSLWPYALVLTTTLLARDGQLLLGLGDDVAIPLTLPLIPLAAWLGLRLASRHVATAPCISASS